MPKLMTSISLAAIGLALATGVWFYGAAPSDAAQITVYKSPTCGCCSKWADHFQANGHSVAVKPVKNMGEIKEIYGVPYGMESCHTAIVDGYVVEGHVPAADVAWLLSTRPDIKGLAVPGMPQGSLGMEGKYTDRYKVMRLERDGSVSLHAQH